MTVGVVVGVAILAGLAAILVAGYLVSRRRAAEVVPGAPDRVSGEVVSGLMGELRKAQAEAAHWRAAAERLQREIDGRD
ncbi:MAG TPA: hypothetical protein VHE57_10235 [Mycobacteriales bacterium]|jgi:hypothetical protein|nr:hypothetical protein [Mycobacteriales bacterium]